VVVLTPKNVDVDRAARRDRERVEDVREHLRAQVAELFTLDAQVCHAERPRADVDYGARERLRAIRRDQGK
jgi:hypothetical protein